MNYPNVQEDQNQQKLSSHFSSQLNKKCSSFSDNNNNNNKRDNNNHISNDFLVLDSEKKEISNTDCFQKKLDDLYNHEMILRWSIIKLYNKEFVEIANKFIEKISILTKERIERLIMSQKKGNSKSLQKHLDPSSLYSQSVSPFMLKKYVDALSLVENASITLSDSSSKEYSIRYPNEYLLEGYKKMLECKSEGEENRIEFEKEKLWEKKLDDGNFVSRQISRIGDTTSASSASSSLAIVPAISSSDILSSKGLTKTPSKDSSRVTTLRSISPHYIVHDDVRLELKLKDAKMKALLRQYQSEKMYGKKMLEKERKITEAYIRRQANLQTKKPSATQTESRTQSQIARLQLQKTKKELEMQARMRDKEMALIAHKHRVVMQRKAEIEAKRQANIIASETINCAASDFKAAEAHIHRQLIKQQQAQLETIKKVDDLCSQRNFMSSNNLKNIDLMRDTFKILNKSTGEELIKKHYSLISEMDRKAAVYNPYSQSENVVVVVPEKDLKVHPTFDSPHKYGRRQKNLPPEIDARLYDRLCGGYNNPFSKPSLEAYAYGGASFPFISSSNNFTPTKTSANTFLSPLFSAAGVYASSNHENYISTDAVFSNFKPTDFSVVERQGKGDLSYDYGKISDKNYISYNENNSAYLEERDFRIRHLIRSPQKNVWK